MRSMGKAIKWTFKATMFLALATVSVIVVLGGLLAIVAGMRKL
ncbi:hypothetical protein WC1_55 [Rhodococcus phage WC1]|uniref:Uncharacterized protein n=3 Tax=Rerduovirus TaxID=1982375 RepID=A0A222ZJ41_9CAUD|nr:hypothetical protein AU091_gp18 [Rhodococcus phage CosmicSans]ALA46258.1 hypothetical protein PBI_RHODALYSA_55 [Rhodococcus phage Rhodalysa]ALN97099.1 hypothetical protein SEA_TWAMP_55 [Rhodococcus phage TWAMP]ALO80653.1 hypothetical protein SEA_LILLIE_55 [Rhodococcus phage Lillie]ASR84302.1 hypothetical protein SEA_STCROIX_54 [Rhodococcus phage StCroix]ASR84362.1 hypothetical protein SEA_NAIAD_54 [Rhodococcus phage Naiad]ASR84435.1 hypothetical protein SEA_KRISHELLE_55 [Rhodococcus phage 